MNKKMNVLKVGLALGIAVMVTGCASLDSVANKHVNNVESGVIYGSSAVELEAANKPFSAKKICDAINNKDPRCVDADNYVTVFTMSKFGYADGPVGMYSLLKKGDPMEASLIRNSGTMQDKNAVYTRTKVTSGQLGEILEIVSANNDGKCQWSGMPRIGGVVCPAYNWDYRNAAFIGVVR